MVIAMDVCYSTLLTTMDTLWFHNLILLPEPLSTLCSKTNIVRDCDTEISLYSEDDCTTSGSSSSLMSQDDYTKELEEEKAPEQAERCSRPTRLTLISNKCRSQSSSPSIHRPRKSSPTHSNDKTNKLLQRFSSSKTMHDLEQLELKGFIDLGFHFEKELLSPRTMNVLPGLQRLGQHDEEQVAFTSLIEDKNVVDEDLCNKGVVVRPYLSEAWLVKKPNSPLLRLQMARVSTAQDMKNCLMLWARTVASSIHSS